MGKVEEVARAIKAKVPRGYGMTSGEALEYARAAIEAMREPTPEMRGAFWDAEDPTDTGFRNAWAAAIDAALSEEQG